jgi:hypothetical protein
LHHEGHVGVVEPARRHVAAKEHLARATSKLVRRFGSRRLALAGVDLQNRVVGGKELLVGLGGGGKRLVGVLRLSFSLGHFQIYNKLRTGEKSLFLAHTYYMDRSNRGFRAVDSPNAV